MSAYLNSERSKEDRFHDDFDDTSKTAALETLLASKLAEFLDSSFPYKLGQLSAAGKEHLYKGPPPDNQEGTWIMELSRLKLPIDACYTGFVTTIILTFNHLCSRSCF